MHVATFSVEAQGAFGEITRDVDATIELWCDDHCDLLMVKGDEENVLRSAIDELIGVRDAMAQDGKQIIITSNCLERHEVTMVESYLSRHNCLLLPPLHYERGYKNYRVLALEPQRLTDVYRDLVEDTQVDVKSKRHVDRIIQISPLFTVGSTMPSLSARQEEVILTAYDLGYYEIPRETTTESIAATVGIERRTAEQHLRRAENKLMDTFVEMYSPMTRA